MDFEKDKTRYEYNFVFTLWKFPKLYSRYISKIEKMDKFFDNKDANFFYVLGKQMYKTGFNNFDMASVISFVSKNKSIEEAFNSKGGYNTFDLIKDELSKDNVGGYFGEILKINCLNELQDSGINIDKDYHKLSQMSPEQIRLFYSYKVNSIFQSNLSETPIEQMLISEEDLSEFDSGAIMGLSIAKTSPLLNYEILGINKGLTFVGGSINQGKAQKLSAKVITPNGYTTIGQIEIGDKICGEDGKVYNVTGVFDRGVRKNYKITFNDGSYTECCDEHLWNINKTTFKDKNKFITVMLKDILNDSVGLKSKSDNAYRYSIPEYQPVYMNKKEHVVHPYLLGVLLGDGYLCGKTLSISSIEPDIIDKCNLLLDDNYIIKKVSNKNYNWNLINTERKYNKYKREIKRLNLEKVSKEKFIPDEYKYDSIENRLELLRGLFDTDGSVATKSNNYSICTKSNKLKDDILFIARSLGMLSSAKWSNRKDDKNKECWYISIRFNENMKPFSSKKHIQKYKPNKRNKSLRRKIASIEYIGEEQMRCIMVDNPTHLYLTDDFIVTHNTSFTLAVIVMGWLKDGRKTCLISNEQTIMEFKQMLLSMAYRELFGDNEISRRRIKIGKYNRDEWDKIKQASEYFNKTYGHLLAFKKIFDYSLEDVQMTIEIMTAQGYEGFVYDVFKADDRTSGRVVDEMVEMSKSLFKTADTNKVSIVATIQLGLGFSNVRFVNMLTISTSKHITEPATEVLLLRTMWEDEVTGGKHDIKIYNYAYNAQGQKILDTNGKPVKKFYEVLGDDYKDIKLLFLAKTRNTKAETVLAYKFNGDCNTWEELGYCSPSHEDRNSKKQ